MGPGTDYEIGAWSDYGPTDFPSLQIGSLRTFIWGRIEYRDIFGVFCYFDFKEVSSNQIDDSMKWTIAAHRSGESERCGDDTSPPGTR
jgi:hypothetical protein